MPSAGRLTPWSTAREKPGEAGSDDCWDDPHGHGAGLFRLGLCLRPGAGAVLRLSPAPAAQAHRGRGPAVSAGPVPEGGGAHVWGLRRGPAARLPGGAVSGDLELRPDRRAAPQAPFCRILENSGAAEAALGPASEKNFPNRKKYVCIWGKMGYNRTEVYPSRQTHSRRYIL